VREYLCGDAAEHHRSDPAPPMWGHNNEIAILFLGGRDYRCIRMIMNDLYRLARHVVDFAESATPVKMRAACAFACSAYYANSFVIWNIFEEGTS